MLWLASTHVEQLALVNVQFASLHDFARGHKAEADLFAALAKHLGQRQCHKVAAQK